MIKRFILVFGISCSGLAFGYDSSIEGGASLTYTDNAGFSSERREEDLISSLTGRYLFRGESSYARLFTSLGATYDHYLENTFTDHLDIEGIVQFAGVISPKQLEWVVENLTTDTFDNPTRFSRTSDGARLNVFSTGPTLMTVINPENTFVLNLRHSIINDEDDVDSIRKKAEGIYAHQFSEVAGFRFITLGEQVEFDEEEQVFLGAMTDFNRYEAFINPYRNGNNNRIEFELGATQIERQTDKEKDTYPRWAFIASHSIENTRGVTLSLSQRFSDSIDNLVTASADLANSSFDQSSSQSSITSSVSGVQQGTSTSLIDDSSNSIVEEKRAELAFSFYNDIANFYPTFYVDRRLTSELFVPGTGDRLRRGADFVFGRRLSARTDAALGIFVSKSIFDNQAVDAEYLQGYVARASYLLAPRLEFSSELSRNVRTEVTSGIPDENTEEHRLMFSVYYLPKF
jgi:hypothetical protein